MNIAAQILSDITVHMKYAKYLPEKERREVWTELVDRNKAMHLKKFPLDSQICPLEIGSFGHPQLDVQYKWAQKPLRSIST